MCYGDGCICDLWKLLDCMGAKQSWSCIYQLKRISWVFSVLLTLIKIWLKCTRTEYVLYGPEFKKYLPCVRSRTRTLPWWLEKNLYPYLLILSNKQHLFGPGIEMTLCTFKFHPQKWVDQIPVMTEKSYPSQGCNVIIPMASLNKWELHWE